MPRDRFFLAGRHAAGDRVAVAPADARKLLSVLRAKSGDTVVLVDTGGTAFDARLEVEGNLVWALLGPVASAQTPESSARIVVAQAIPKGQKMDLIVEKATELGVAAIVPLRTERVLGDHTGSQKLERWQRIAKAAAQQAGRTRIPQIAPVIDWDGLHAMFARYDRVYLAWEGASQVPLRERFESEIPSAAAILIVVGPEGGFSTAEVATAQSHGAQPISLGPRILRTETAALVVLAALLYARGEL